MNVFPKSAPKPLPQQESDLVAEGGNVLASDDAHVRPRLLEYLPTTRLRLSSSGKWIARVLKPRSGQK